jgi:hypothetical protein
LVVRYVSTDIPRNLGEGIMYTVETVESLHSYADRLHRERTSVAPGVLPRRSAMRALVRRVLRSA